MLAQGSRASWATIVLLGVLTGAAAVLSVVTAPANRYATSSTSTTTPATFPTTTIGTGATCSLPPDSPSITLSDMVPSPTVTVPVGARIVVMVPRWGWGDATDVRIGNSTILSEQCSVLLANHGRRTILVALGPGRSSLGATVTPASNAAMPAWLGTVVVTANANG